MKHIYSLMAAMSICGTASATYSLKWTWDTKPPSTVSAGGTFSVKGHWDVRYSTSTGSSGQRLYATWSIVTGNGSKLSATSFRANSTLKLWGSAISASSEVPNLSQYVTVTVQKQSDDDEDSPTQTSDGFVPPVVTNTPAIIQTADISYVGAEQRYPWTNLVDIECLLTSLRPTSWYKFTLSCCDKSTGTSYPIAHLQTNDGIESDNPIYLPQDDKRSKTFVWDAAKDIPKDLVSTNFVVDAEVQVRYPQYICFKLDGWSWNDFLEIYVSKMPMTAYESIPPEGWTNDIYRTQYLVMRRINPGNYLYQDKQQPCTISRPYYISIFELTESQYDRAENGSATNQSMMPKLMTYDAALAFASSLSKKSGYSGFDLPTEAQWEFACCAGSPDEPLPQHFKYLGRYKDNQPTSEPCMAVVGSYYPNSWSLYDMRGNAMELCKDFFNIIDRRRMDPITDPIEMENHYGTARHVIKGGNYMCEYFNLQTHARTWTEAAEGNVGVRLIYRLDEYDASKVVEEEK